MKSRTMCALTLISMMFTAVITHGQPGVHTAKTSSEVLDLIRKEKLDLILPGAMRDNNVDMWIHVTRTGDPDPLYPHFGTEDVKELVETIISDSWSFPALRP